MSSSEVAAKVGVPERLVLRWARTGKIATFHHGRGQPMFLASEVRRMVTRAVRSR